MLGCRFVSPLLRDMGIGENLGADNPATEMKIPLQVNARRTSTIIHLFLTSCLLIPSFTHAQSSGYRIAGMVVSKNDGHPLARTRVTLSDTKNEQKSASVLTGDDGRFEFTSVPAGKYSLHGAKRGFIGSYYDQHENFWTGIVTGAGLDTESLVLKLAPSATIAGQVLDESGDPSRRARVTLYRVDHSQGSEEIRTIGNTETDDLGAYEFSSLNAGTYFVSVSARPWYAVHQPSEVGNSGEPASNFDRTLDVTYPVVYYADTPDADSATPIPIRGGERLQVDLHLTPVPGLHLVFRVPGNTKQGFTFPTLEQPTFDGSAPVETGPSRMVSPGVVEISGIPAGRYNIRLNGPTTNLEMNGVDLTRDGEQVDTSSAENLADVKITAQMSDGSAMPKQSVVVLHSKSRSNSRGSIVDEKGQADLPQISPGTYAPSAFGGGKQFSIAQISAEGAEVTGHTLSVQPGASVSLSLKLSSGSTDVDGVVKHSGKPFAGAMVVLVPKDAEGNRDLFRRDQSDLDGTFSLHDVIPGSYTLTAIENGWDLDWSQPDVIAAYAKHGQVIQVVGGSNLKVRVPEPIEVQAR